MGYSILIAGRFPIECASCVILALRVLPLFLAYTRACKRIYQRIYFTLILRYRATLFTDFSRCVDYRVNPAVHHISIIYTHSNIKQFLELGAVRRPLHLRGGCAGQPQKCSIPRPYFGGAFLLLFCFCFVRCFLLLSAELTRELLLKKK